MDIDFPRRLLVVSHTAHYRHEGGLVGFGPTIEELSRLATLFEELIHVAPLHDGPPPRNVSPYRAPNVRYVPVPPAGGMGLKGKGAVVRAWPVYWAAIARELRKADAVHVRAPANIALLAMIQLIIKKHPRRRWIKYAGNWRPTTRQAISYDIQRWLLRKGWSRACVTVNGAWKEDPAHVRSFFNPSFSEAARRKAAEAVKDKKLSAPYQLLFVGRVEKEKGIYTAMETIKTLRGENVPFEFHVVGDGPAREAVERMVHETGLSPRVRLYGWLPRSRIAPLYQKAHFILLPTYASEGWPKVLSEAMSYGAVPLSSTISSIPQFLARFDVGKALDFSDPYQYYKAIMDYISMPDRWLREKNKAVEAARFFTFEYYLRSVRRLFEERCF